MANGRREEDHRGEGQNNCPHSEEVERIRYLLYGNGEPGLKGNVEQLMGWQVREADRSKGNRYLLVAILTVLLPIAVTRILDYTTTGTKMQATTTITDQGVRSTTTTTGTRK